MRKTALGLILLAVCSTAAKKSFEPQAVILARVPAKARAKPNPLANDPIAPVAGKKLFEQHCAECHGEGAQGTKRGPMLVGPSATQATPGDLFWLITNGIVRRGMPAWSKLPEPQRWQLTAFLTSK